MPIYRAKIVGRTAPLLLKAESAAKAKDALVEVEALTNSEMAEAFGEPVWKPGDALPKDAGETA